MASKMIKIDIVSDAVCPWCYVGYRKLLPAIDSFKQSHPKVDFQVKWHPFYLRPDAPVPGEDKRAMYEKRLGGPERVKAMSERLSAIGNSVGINFSYGGKTGRTKDAHRLIAYADEKGKQTPVVEQLFKAYFEEEKDITDHEVLLKAAEEAGLERAKAEDYLKSGKGKKEVDKEAGEWKMRGVSGVPTFFVDGECLGSGAMDPSEFLSVFEGRA